MKNLVHDNVNSLFEYSAFVIIVYPRSMSKQHGVQNGLTTMKMACMSSIKWYQSKGALDLGIYKVFRRKFESGAYVRNFLQGCFQTAISPSLTVGSG